MIRLLIAAPSPVVRAGLEALAVSVPGVDVIGSFPDLAEVDDLHPDVVLAAIPHGDIAPPVDGSPPAYVLLGSASQPGWTHDALRLGVRAVLPPDVSPAGILAAIEAAASGLAVIDPRELDTLVAPAPPAETPILTARERQVLALMAEGAANKTIAWKLAISEHTVKFHVASILTKLNAASRTEAVTTGIRKGLVLAYATPPAPAAAHPANSPARPATYNPANRLWPSMSRDTGYKCPDRPCRPNCRPRSGAPIGNRYRRPSAGPPG